ncbi:hypothetical protein HMPREF1531_02076 [Propionibacterium sp. oral taxon 192 str. F0372]|uniref:FMN-binding negative transcriptional regulator n=1 Tax=Propionibacterium sp. oral taxon 192 TaxID=671222 RepID=UPI000352E080|nr:FMN-binding negative transcriptional regulator [Propionibacterium sp. oral taxon 192]EPH02765.1 hypothetical protein HMPREF1531_02076 [Propionibacterium sp. oral taxon 192 str. F0372]
MYVAEQYAMTPQQAWAHVEDTGAGDLVTHSERGIDVTFLPFVVVRDQERTSLITHLARTNLQWQDEGEATWVVHGPDAYISPTLCDPQAPDARVATVPTWDYVTVHITGRLVAHHDEEWKFESLRQMVDRFEERWTLEAGGINLVRQMLPAIVGVELVVTGIVGKAKLSQNKSTSEVTRIADHLATTGHCPHIAEIMRQLAVPYTVAREQRVAWAKGLRLENRRGSAAT